MAPGVGLAWTPGERLITAVGAEPSCELAAWEFPAPFRKLFFQGHLHFMARAPALERSRAFRAAMLECLEGIHDEDSPHDRDLREALTVWSFVEAVYLVDPAHDSSHVSARLADWYALNFLDLHEIADEVLKSDVDPSGADEEDQFWALVTRLAAVGSRAMAHRIISARIARGGFDRDWAEAAGAAALRVSGEDIDPSKHSPLAVAEAMLAECPVTLESSFATRSDSSWSEWQDTCDAWAEEQMESEEMRSVLLLKVLAGSIPHIAKACPTWEELFVGTATYGRHVLSDSRYDQGVVEVENACAEATSVYPAPEHIAGGALVEAALGQPADAVVCLGASLNTTWYAAHLCDLLMQARRIRPDAGAKWMPAPGNVALLEHLILEFAGKLELHHGMWRIAADYYSQCPKKGRQRLNELMGRVVTSGAVEPVIEKVVSFCVANKLPEAMTSVCTRVGAECAHTKNYGGAVFWFSRGSLLNRVVSVTNTAISEAEIGGPGSMSARGLVHVVSALSAAGATDSTKERVAYAVVYVQFQDAVSETFRLCDDRDIQGTGPSELAEAVGRAERLALRLVCGGGLPRRFWGTVVYDVCCVLKEVPGSPELFATDTLYELLGALEILCSPSGYTDSLEGLSRRLAKKGARPSEKGVRFDSEVGVSSVDAAMGMMRETLMHAVTSSFASEFS